LQICLLKQIKAYMIANKSTIEALGAAVTLPPKQKLKSKVMHLSPLGLPSLTNSNTALTQNAFSAQSADTPMPSLSTTKPK
jgi:hypothetical protein